MRDASVCDQGFAWCKGQQSNEQSGWWETQQRPIRWKPPRLVEKPPSNHEMIQESAYHTPDMRTERKSTESLQNTGGHDPCCWLLPVPSQMSRVNFPMSKGGTWRLNKQHECSEHVHASDRIGQLRGWWAVPADQKEVEQPPGLRESVSTMHHLPWSADEPEGQCEAWLCSWEGWATMVRPGKTVPFERKFWHRTYSEGPEYPEYVMHIRDT